MLSSFIRSFSEQTGISKAPMEYKTKYTNIPYETLSVTRKVIEQNGGSLEEIDIELVLRSFDLLSDVTKERAIAICNQYLKTNPAHDFFNLAAAFLTDEVRSKENYLLNSAKSTYEDKTLAAQAALELSKLYFNTDKYTESQAWLIYAIILGNQKAIERYKMGMQEELHFTEIGEALLHGHRFALKWLLQTSVIALILSNVKVTLGAMPQGYWSRIYCSGKDPVKDLEGFYRRMNCYSRINRANETVNVFQSLSLLQDSILGDLTADTFDADEQLFREFFSYCNKNQIISNDVYALIQNFMANYTITIQEKDTQVQSLQHQPELADSMISNQQLSSQALIYKQFNQPVKQITNFKNIYPVFIPVVNQADGYSTPGIENERDLYSENIMVKDNRSVTNPPYQFPSVPRMDLLSEIFPAVPVHPLFNEGNRMEEKEKRYELRGI